MNIPHSIEICLCMIQIQIQIQTRWKRWEALSLLNKEKYIFDFALLLMKKAMGGSDTKL